MKLGEALSKLKKEQSKLSRLISLRKEHVYKEKGRKTMFDPKKLSKEIEMKTREIRKLKISIQKTNLQTTVQGEKMLVAEAIIKINDIRNEIGKLSELFEKNRDRWFRDKDEVEKVPLLDEREVEGTIEKLEIEKAQLDNKIQITNWTTSLID